MQTLGSLGESAVLERIFPRLPAARAQLLGPGDDAAIVAAPDGRVVVTTDTMIHGPDFRLAWSGPRELGWKAAASNLADIAAMGAWPTALVVALAAPADTDIAFLEGFADGLREACAALAPGCGVVGGDLSVSTVFTIAVTALGDLEGREPVLRSGARPGDIVAVSGPLGAAAEGLRLLFELGTVDGVPDAAATATLRAGHPAALAAQLTPSPPIADGRAAALAGATAMLDLSDGLAIDARRIATASGVAIDLDLGLDGDDRAQLLGGEDHSLLATFPGAFGSGGLASAGRPSAGRPSAGPGFALPGGFRAIGRVVAGSGVLVRGEPFDERGGWDPYAGWDGVAG
jgi:thiamine-monophosphate kinase